MVLEKLEDHNSYQGDTGGQLGVVCMIQIIESILGSTTLVVDRYDNISVRKQALIHLEALTLWWKQEGPISFLSGVYHSIDYGVSLLHVYVHHNSGKSVSTLTALSSLNVWLDVLEEHIMASFLISPAKRTTIVVGFSDPYVPPCFKSVVGHLGLYFPGMFVIGYLWLSPPQTTNSIYP